MEIQILLEQQNQEFNEAEDQERQQLLAQLNMADKQVESGIPFPELSLGQFRAIEVLYPVQTEVNAYHGYLPTPVLRTIATQKSNFDSLWVMSDLRSDPILVGSITHKQRTWERTYFLMARWGVTLEPIEKLFEKARETWIQRRQAILSSALSRIESDAIDHFAGKSVETI